MVEDVTVTTIQELISVMNDARSSWHTTTRPWFRGEPRLVPKPLCPKLYREPHDELQLLMYFRMKAPTYIDIQIPQQGHTDQWLFLAQHAGLPTRLLDWTEGLLIALHFALQKPELGAIVWMLNPNALNQYSCNRRIPDNDYPITWFAPELDVTVWIRHLFHPDQLAQGKTPDYSSDIKDFIAKDRVTYNYGNQNVRAAWEENPGLATKYPVAIHPTAIHPRLTVQKSTFTIWGSDKRCLADMVGSEVLRKFVIEDGAIDVLKSELQILGISSSSLFPDMDHLASDLTNLF